MYAEILEEMRELDSRVSDGIHVRLLCAAAHGAGARAGSSPTPSSAPPSRAA